MKKIKIDCVEMTRKIRDTLYLETKDLTTEELIERYSHPSKDVNKQQPSKRRLKAA